MFFADFIRSCLSFVPLFGTSSSSLFLFFCDRKKERYFEIHIKREYIECERKEESFGKRDRGYFCSSRSSSEGFVRAERGRNTIDALSSLLLLLLLLFFFAISSLFELRERETNERRR